MIVFSLLGHYQCQGLSFLVSDLFKKHNQILFLHPLIMRLQFAYLFMFYEHCRLSILLRQQSISVFYLLFALYEISL